MTDLEIVNRALALLGTPAATSMADTAKNAAAAIAAYEDCRDEILSLRAWPCVTKRKTLKGWHDQATPWTASHFYEIGDRVTNDTAKTYQCVTAGRSAAAGGPTGTSTAIADGAAVWDYKEASTAANNWAWITLTAYYVGDVVSWNTGKVYVCITAGTSGATGPTGTSSDITDGTVHWRYFGTPRPAGLFTHLYAYVLPNDCLLVVKLPQPGATSERDQGQDYKLEGMCVYCDEDPTTLVYVFEETDPTGWDRMLRAVIVHRLAAEIAYQVTGEEDKKKDMEARFSSWFSTAEKRAMKESTEAPKRPALWTDIR